MVEDDVLRNVRAAREAYARLHNFDLQAIVADLRARDLADDWPIVRHPPRSPSRSMAPVGAPNQALHPNRIAIADCESSTLAQAAPAVEC